MNHVFALRWSRSQCAVVPVPETLTKRSTGRRKIGSFSFATCFGLRLLIAASIAATGVPNVAQAALVGSVDGSPTGGVSTPSLSSYQLYSYSVTAQSSQSYLTFTFRNDPAFWYLDTISLAAQGSSSNLLQNGGLDTPGATVGNVIAPANWELIGQQGLGAAGTWTSGPGAQAGSGYWYDGAVNGFDGISQLVSTVVGQTYNLEFYLYSDAAPNTSNVTANIYFGVSQPAGFTPLGLPNITSAVTQFSAVGSSVTTEFDGGSLSNPSDATISSDFTVTSNGGTLDAAGHTLTFTGVISNATSGTPGGISIADSGSGGAIVLSGANSYTGSTIVDPGATLALSGAGSIASSAGVADNGTFDISGTGTSVVSIRALAGSGTVRLGAQTLQFTNASGTFDGTISGTGGITVASGTQTLSGSNTYSGTTTVDPGSTLAIQGSGSLGTGLLNLVGTATTPSTLDVMGSTTIGNAVEVTADPVFNIPSGTTTTISGVISDGTSPGDVVKEGGGTLVLTAANTYTGPTSVDAGTLELLGSVTSPVTVYQGSEFSGTGTVSSTLTNNGLVQPGAGGGTGILTVSGNYTQGPTGTLGLTVTPSVTPGTGYDQLLVGGSAALAGTLNIGVQNGTYTIGAKYQLVHASGGVSGQFANVAYSSAFAPYISPEITYQGDNVYLDLSPTPVVFDSGRANVANTYVQDQSLFDLADAALTGGGVPGLAFAAPHRNLWADGIGGEGRANGFSVNYKGGLVGRSFTVRPHLTLGIDVSTVSTTTSGPFATVYGSSVGVSGYGIYQRRRLRASVAAGVGHLNNTMDRSIPSLGAGAEGTNSGFYDFIAARLRYQFTRGRIFAVPDLEAAYVHTNVGSMTETGAGALNLHYDGIGSDIGRVAVGLTSGVRIHRSYGTIVPWVRIGGYETIGNRNIDNVETVALATSTQTAVAAQGSAATVGAGVEFTHGHNWRMSLGWTGAYGNSTRSNDFSANLSYVW